MGSIQYNRIRLKDAIISNCLIDESILSKENYSLIDVCGLGFAFNSLNGFAYKIACKRLKPGAKSPVNVVLSYSELLRKHK